ncbi:MAG: HipA domain-containing protein [Acidothermaceae bacterium]
MDLDLRLGERLLARTVTSSRGAKVRISYTEEIAEQYGAEAPLLSCSLPTPGPSEPVKARAFLEGLLPEGRALAAAAAQIRGTKLDSDGAPATPADTMLLLAEYGRDCAGAIVVVPAGAEPPGPGEYSEPLTDEQLASMIRNIPTRPLGADPARGIRMSLAGAQDKLLLARIHGTWREPLEGAPSTHIAKPTTTWPHSAENEALVMHLGRIAGLTSHRVWVEKMGGTSVLIAERYDRRVDGDTIKRLHQEDMCQANGIRPKHKYNIGRPSENMAKLLRVWADTPRQAIAELFRQVAFRAIAGDEDGHGKNYSLLLDDGKVRLAPLYDSLCTLVYPDLDGKMAAPIGGQVNLAKVDRQALTDEGIAMGLTPAEVAEHLNSLSADLRDGLNSMPPEITDGWPAEQVVGLINDRVKHLESGAPLGGTDDADRPGPTLDQATARRPRTTSQA